MALDVPLLKYGSIRFLSTSFNDLAATENSPLGSGRTWLELNDNTAVAAQATVNAVVLMKLRIFSE